MHPSSRDLINRYFNHRLKSNIMNSKNHISTKTITTANLIGETRHRNFLDLQAAFGIAQRGGVVYPSFDQAHSKRLASDVNILSSSENRELIFSESIFSN